MLTPILQILGGIVGMIAMWYISKMVANWVNVYNRAQDEKAITAAKQQAAHDAQTTQSTIDKADKLAGNS